MTFALPARFRSAKKQPDSVYTHPRYLELVQDLAATKSALDDIYTNFENVVDPDLIDCYIYEMNAAQKRYQFLLERAKQMNS